ncbi:SLC13 family permease [Rheinheimera maricola]|uniref:SLC13 family permease n=1 Tax=Rheinheimera maricola TaxID=2793282 RepID=A0ABS7X6H9_9GAMM|nr:SLC13 family permease [Rheinheimera maricola]MBZ9611149.1 SLC13 family permease [Rheinheimera maricola]
MTVEIALVLLILAAALLLFVTGWLRMDVVALLVLCVLALLGLVSPAEAVSGFSNPAVITVWAMFILSEGLTRAGIADGIGRRVIRLSGNSETQMIVVIMLVAGMLSAFMSNIGVVALLLPVTVEATRRCGIPPAKVLMPMAFGAMLGGLVTLIGTPPNLLVSIALEKTGQQGFSLFDFALIGLPVLLAGTLFVAFIGRHLLPDTDPGRAGLAGSKSLSEQYGLQERIFALRLPTPSLLAGHTLEESGLINTAGLMVIAITRGNETFTLPSRHTVLKAGDIVLAQGKFSRFERLRSWNSLTIEREAPILHEKLLAASAVAELNIAADSSLVGEVLQHYRFRELYQLNVLAIKRAGQTLRTRLTDLSLEGGDKILVQGSQSAVEQINKHSEFSNVQLLGADEVKQQYKLEERLFVLGLPADSPLVDSTFADNRLGDAFDFRLLGLFRQGEIMQQFHSDDKLLAGDLLLIQGREEDLDILRGFKELQRQDDMLPYLDLLAKGKLELVEATLHPRSKYIGQSVNALQLDTRYKVEVSAIWRQGRAYRSALGSMILQAGDALLIVGPRPRLGMLTDSEHLIVMNPVQVKPVNVSKAPLAAGLMGLMVLLTVTGVLPVYLAAVLAATLMVASRCLTMEQAYAAIDWRSIFLISGMLPLGLAMQHSGTAAWLADGVQAGLGQFGPLAVMAGLYLVTALGTLVVPTVALVLIMAPIGLLLSTALGVSGHSAMMVVAVAATSLASPVSHAANTLVMGPGGYRFVDYLKVGGPLSLLLFIITMALLPIFWPLTAS